MAALAEPVDAPEAWEMDLSLTVIRAGTRLAEEQVVGNYNNNDRQNYSAAPAAFLLPAGAPGEPLDASPALAKSNTVKTLEKLPRLLSLCYHHLIGQ
jgi:hypothetical protein